MNKKIIFAIFILLLILFLCFVFNSNNTSSDKNNWSINKNEYPKEEYRLDDLPVSHRSPAEVRQFFEDSDTNHDGVLKGVELDYFDFKIKHSQYTFNGPYGYN